jgi:hypothetical protein
VRRAELDEIHRRAADQARTVGDDLEELQHAMSAQRAQVEQVDGELAVLVAAEQARVAEAARQEQARRDAEAASARAAQVNVAVPIPYISSGPRATTGPVLSMEEAFACIRQLESGNDYSSGGGGAYQFLDSTWQSLGYDGSAQDHPPAAQDEGARRLQARSGWGQWTTAVYCGLL